MWRGLKRFSREWDAYFWRDVELWETDPRFEKVQWLKISLLSERIHDNRSEGEHSFSLRKVTMPTNIGTMNGSLMGSGFVEKYSRAGASFGERLEQQRQFDGWESLTDFVWDIRGTENKPNPCLWWVVVSDSHLHISELQFLPSDILQWIRPRATSHDCCFTVA